MKKRLIFLGMAVFFAMVAVIAFAFVQTGRFLFRYYFLLMTSGAFSLLSLMGVVAPQKMQWLMDICKSKNED